MIRAREVFYGESDADGVTVSVGWHEGRLYLTDEYGELLLACARAPELDNDTRFGWRTATGKPFTTDKNDTNACKEQSQ